LAAVTAGLSLAACSGVPDDVNVVPVATQPTEATASQGSAGVSAAPAASSLPLISVADAPWTTAEVIDGDTIRVVGPDGEQTVRMIGINAPERGECFYDEATSALQFSLGDRDLRLVSDVSDVDQYGRSLRYVELDDGTDVGAELVKGGFVRSRHYEPDISRNDEYDHLQDQAEQAGVGLWAPDACGPPVTSGVSIAVDGHYDAPGDDNLNLNEEWVRFTNTGTAQLDLSGWQVADESSSHRYTFDDLTLAPGASVTLFTGCGADTDTERHWCNEDSAVWNNSGDTVFLLDPSGNNVVAETYRG
jgi:endonuclease YncB( thermonuclease family)